MYVPRYGWKAKLAEGAAGVTRLVAHLEAEGHAVEDVQADKGWRKRDVDLIVNGQWVEVKTDSHAPETVFLEITCNNRPGCVFKSSADLWLYYFPSAGVAWWLVMPNLRHFLAHHAYRYPLKVIESNAGKRTWRAEGIVVPLSVLTEYGATRGSETLSA
jgi:hypothetical protein